MAEGKSRELPTWLSVLLTVGAPVVAVSVGWWLSAEGSRQEGLRTDRREAYAEMVAASAECGGGSFADLGQQVALDTARLPEFADLFNTPEARAYMAEVQTQLLERWRTCFSRIQSATARVAILSDDTRVIAAAEDLELAALDLVNDVLGSEQTDDSSPDVDYFTSLTRFERAARADATEPVPFVPSQAGRLVAVIAGGLGIAAVYVLVVLTVYAAVRLLFSTARRPGSRGASTAPDSEAAVTASAETESEHEPTSRPRRG